MVTAHSPHGAAGLGKAVPDAVRRHRADALEWLAALVAIDSEAPNERAAQVLVAEIARTQGLVATIVASDPRGDLATDERFIETGMSYAERPNCRIELPDARGRPIVCNAHIDTVAIGEGWTRNPDGERVDGRMYGRGTCDTKASLVAAIVASRVLLELGEPPRAPIEIHSVIDEEPSGNGTLAMLRELPDDRPPPALAVVMEPTRLDVLLGHRGMVWRQLRCLGRQGHGSLGTGINAIERAAQVVAALVEVNETFAAWPSNEWATPRINVGMINGGHEVYTVPASCTVDFSVRFAPRQLDALTGAIDDALATLPTGAFETVFARTFDASESDENDPAVAQLIEAARGHLPIARVGRLAGTCDMRHYRNRLGVPSVIFGPGDLGDAHGPDEFVEIEDIFHASAVLVQTALNWRVDP